MKQLGIAFVVLSVLDIITVALKLQGMVWEILFLLVGVGATIFIPQPNKILALKLHWRITLLVAVMCTFTIVWMSARLILGNYQIYSLSVTLFAFGLLAFLFTALD